jgi:hypothetical protein
MGRHCRLVACVDHGQVLVDGAAAEELGHVFLSDDLVVLLLAPGVCTAAALVATHGVSDDVAQGL